MNDEKIRDYLKDHLILDVSGSCREMIVDDAGLFLQVVANSGYYIDEIGFWGYCPISSKDSLGGGGPIDRKNKDYYFSEINYWGKTFRQNSPISEISDYMNEHQKRFPDRKIYPAFSIQRKEDEKPDVVSAHRHCTGNKDELKRSTVCGCFYCRSIYSPDEITDYIDRSTTALCPRCGIDSVIGDASGLPVTEEFLTRMNRYWF